MPKHLIQARWIVHGGKKTWRVLTPKILRCEDLPDSRYFGDDKKAADRWVDELNQMRRVGPNRFSGLPFDVRTAVFLALEKLGEGNGTKLVDAAELWVKANRREALTVAEAVAKCVQSREDVGKRGRSVYALENSLLKFAEGREAMPLCDVTASMVWEWINSPAKTKGKNAKPFPASISTKRSRQIYANTLFNFAVKREWIEKNPAGMLERFEYEGKEPEVLTVDQCKAVLEAARVVHGGALLALVALQMFGGIRPEETYKLAHDPENPQAGNIRGGIVAITANIAKMNDRRNVDINPTLKAWLDYAFAHGATLPVVDPQRRMTAIRKASKVHPWPQDGMRHSFVSYHSQIHGWEETVRQAGHSLAMMLKHYKSIVTTESANDFWSIKPE